MNRFYSLLLATAIVVFASIPSFAQSSSNDTVVVQTLTFDSLSRTGVYKFPDNDATSYEKVLMQYTMRCHHALVSNGTKTEQGCGQWDYNCETFIWDSTRVDSVRQAINTPAISNWGGGSFPFSLTPTRTAIRRDEKAVSFNFPPDVAKHTIGTSTLKLTNPYSTATQSGRSIYLLKASELLTAGVKTGAIDGIQLAQGNSSSIGTGLGAMRIRIRPTTATAVTESMLHDTAFKPYYYYTTPFSLLFTGLYFYKPFAWDGTSNILVEISYANADPATNDTVKAQDAGYPSALTAGSNESVIRFSGSESIQLNPSSLSTISNQVTAAIWVYGDTTQLPGANTVIFEGVDGTGARELNVHLPWGDGQVYWDCGGAGGTGFDRIQKTATKIEAAGRWNHWAFTKNCTTGRMSIYLNGSLWLSDTGKRHPIDLQKMLLGAGITANAGYYGKASRFMLFNRELDSIHIKEIMAEDVTLADSNSAGLVAYYKLNEGSGTTLHDFSANNKTLKTNGVPVWQKLNGVELFTNATISSIRPLFSLLQLPAGVKPTVNDAYEYDSLTDPLHNVIRYAAVNDSIVTIDTTYKYLAGKHYTFDEAGNHIDSTNISAADSIRFETLHYFSKGPQKFEIMSFVTPYGINLDLGKTGKMYEFDVTDYLPILHGYHRLSMERGSGQEEFDIKFLFIKGTPAHKVLDIQQIWPMTEEGYQSILSNDKYEPRRVYLNPLASDFKLRSMITGHGQEGEFITRNHYLTVDSTRYEWEVVKTCGDNPLYPQGGTWLYTRAGWCPGAPTLLTEWDITNKVKPGDSVTIDYGVVTASGDSRYDPSNQLVSYGAPNFTNNAGVMEIVRPSDRTEFGRVNPACDLPIVVIKNNGSAPLKSVAIDYYVSGGKHLTFNWTGNLAFLDTTTVVLPVPDLSFWTGTADTFHVDLSLPNGVVDEYAGDSHYASHFVAPAAYQGAIVVNFKSNIASSDNYYEVRDMTGQVVYQHDSFDPNTTYYDSLALPVGCYSLIMYDASGDGLSFFANTAQGSGSLKLRQSSRTGKVLYTFNPDFGMFTQYDFSIVSSSVVGQDHGGQPFQRMSIYPNPAHQKLTLELENYPTQMVTIEILDATGKSMRREQRFTDGSNTLRAELDLSKLARGNYVLRTTSTSGESVRNFVVE